MKKKIIAALLFAFVSVATATETFAADWHHHHRAHRMMHHHHEYHRGYVRHW